MKSIDIKGTTFSLPSSWNDITLRQQIEVDKLAKDNPDYASLAVIAGYAGRDVATIKHLHVNDIRLILNELSFLSTPCEQIPVHEFEYKGDNYNVMDTLLKAQFQDFLSIEVVLDNNKGKEYQALPYIIAVLAKKAGETLDKYDLDERAEHFLDLPLPIANNIYFFFAMTGLLSSIDSRRILKAVDQDINESINSILNSDKRRVGGAWYYRFVRMILRIYLKSLQRSWRQYYSGYNSETEKPTLIKRFKKLLKRKPKRN